MPWPNFLCVDLDVFSMLVYTRPTNIEKTTCNLIYGYRLIMTDDMEAHVLGWLFNGTYNHICKHLNKA